MSSILSIIVVLVLSFSAHRMLHIWHRTSGKVSFASTFIYAVGGIVLFFLLEWQQSHLLLSSLVVYLLCSGILSFFYLTIVLGGETPSSMILDALSTARSMSEKELYKLFSEKQLIWKRIDDLKGSTLIAFDGEKIVCTPKGLSIVRIMSWYRWVFHRQLGG